MSGAFELKFIAKLSPLSKERINFNRPLGPHIEAIAADNVSASIAMRSELIGH